MNVLAEIFMDYGDKWEAAWQEHVKHWSPPATGSGFDKYTSPAELNANTGVVDEHFMTNNLRETQETFEDTNIFTGCLYWRTQLDTMGAWARLKPDANWKVLSDEDILERYSDDGSFYNGDYEKHYDHTYWRCSIIRSQDDGLVVRIEPSWGLDTAWNEKNLPRFLTNYPVSSIRYFNTPYTSDQFLPGAFRRFIELRDDMLPEHWKTSTTEEAA
jgi:hypothetical protein